MILCKKFYQVIHNDYINSYYTQGYTDVLSMLDNASIRYTYHQHTGNSSTEGGCYSVCKVISTTTADKEEWYGKCPACGAWSWHEPNTAININYNCGTSVKNTKIFECLTFYWTY